MANFTIQHNPLRQAAHRYTTIGWPVFACQPNGKRPMTTRGLHDATTDPQIIDQWWGRWPDANIGLRTGAISRLVVIDVDGEEGADSLHDLERSYGELPRTASVATPGGGMHLYFKHPGFEVRNSVSQLAPRIDVRGDGGYVIAPPSRAGNGNAYVPDEQAPVAALPGWLLALVRRSVRPAGVPVDASEWVRIHRDGLGVGERNNGLARYAGHLLSRGHDPRLVLEILLDVNGRCRPPLSRGEVVRVVESIWRLEQRKGYSRAREEAA